MGREGFEPPLNRLWELQRRIGNEITKSTLTKQLRELEHDGWINRKIYQEIPPKVEYTLTELAESFVPVLEQMKEWSETHLCWLLMPAKIKRRIISKTSGQIVPKSQLYSILWFDHSSHKKMKLNSRYHENQNRSNNKSWNVKLHQVILWR